MYTESITVNGTTYKMIDKAEIRQEHLPMHKKENDYGSWFGVKADEIPDGNGTVALYEFKYVLIDPEDYENGPEWYNNIDWEVPDDIVESHYKWLEAEQRMV